VSQLIKGGVQGEAAWLGCTTQRRYNCFAGDTQEEFVLAVYTLTMRLYLSSYRIGNQPEQVRSFAAGRMLAFIPNAMDHVEAEAGEKSNAVALEELRSVGIDYLILPHYKSDHPESNDIDKEVEFCKREGIRFRPLRDGEVITMDTLVSDGSA
jgi:hypothetical protein